MRKNRILLFRTLIFSAFILMNISGRSACAQDRVRVFINLDFNRVAPEKTAGYLQLEDSIWKPIQQEHIRAGGLAGWNVFRVWFTGTDSKYNYIVKEIYNKYEDMAFEYGDEILKKVHPGINEAKLMEDTYNAREIAEAQSAVRLAMLRPAERKAPARYILVTYMNIKKSNEAQFEKNILELAMPALQDRMQNGFNQGWDLYKVVVPGGDSVPYQYISFEYLDTMGLVVKPGGEDASKGMEPGKIYRTELWERVNFLGGD
jgi:hypothetical protein